MTFQSQVPAPALTSIYSTDAQPIQAMWWGDYTTTPGHRYRYTVLPRYGTPGNLTGKDSVTAELEVTPNDPTPAPTASTPAERPPVDPHPSSAPVEV